MTTLDAHHTAYDENFVIDNRLMLTWYPGRVARLAKGTSMLELGLGHGYSTAFFAQRFQRYSVIEGSGEMIERFRNKFSDVTVDIIQAYFEDFSTDERFDAIGMGFILEHVADPELILRQYREFLTPGGSIFIAVPNCESLHRRFGHAAGLLPDMTALSQADLDFGHRRYFSLQTLTELVEQTGHRIAAAEGILLKPITSQQMTDLQLPERVLQAMLEVGTGYPELCNAILVQAVPV